MYKYLKFKCEKKFLIIMRRVVVTGMGAVSSIGSDLETIWANLKNGQSNVVELPGFKEAGLNTWIGSPAVFDPDLHDCLDPKDKRRLDEVVMFAIAAGHLAVNNALVNGKSVLDHYEPTRRGISTGCGIGGKKSDDENSEKFSAKGLRAVSPFYVINFMGNGAAGQLSNRLQLKGYIDNHHLACSSSALPFLDAYRTITTGEVDMMLIGGQESTMTMSTYAGFNVIRAMTTQNELEKVTDNNGNEKLISNQPRPFDRDRDGFLMGNGAAYLVLEELKNARNRGARIYAELLGGGVTGEAFNMVAPDEKGDGAYECMKKALDICGLSVKDIDYINTHGTATPIGDISESAAINRLLGDQTMEVPINSTKSIVGHLLGASGAMEGIATILQMWHRELHPSINCENQDETLKVNVVKEANPYEMKIALVNSFGFGGANACFALRNSKYM